MTRVTLDVPEKKMQSFQKAILHLGINRKAFHPPLKKKYCEWLYPVFSMRKLDKISRSFILFDWEFFSSELEYE